MGSRSPELGGRSTQQKPPAADFRIHTYHCLCSTLLLTTPYALTDLPMRAAASGDQARILPLPPLSLEKEITGDTADIGGATDEQSDAFLPSLLANTRPARKAVVVQREDGYEKRRMWRCNRCALGWGYEVEIDGEAEAKENKTRMLYLPEGGLVETDGMRREKGR